MKLTHIDLFSGIGGFALAARWAGIKTVQFVEIDPFCQKVLQKNFKGVPIHDDIKTFTNTNWSGLQEQRAEQQTGGNRQLYETSSNAEGGESGEPPESEGWKNIGGGNSEGRPFLLTGGFPCQPFSCAGKRRGKEDDRYLWEEMLRVIKEFKPTWIIGENVNGIRSMEFQDGVSELEGDTIIQEDGNSYYTNVLDGICDSLEAIGYEVQPVIIPACAVNAPHRRDRVWIVAHAESKRGGGKPKEICGEKCRQVNELLSNTFNTDCHAPDTEHNQAARHGQDGGRTLPITGSEGLNNGNQWEQDWYSVALRTCVRGVDDGVSRQVDRVNRLKALGNAVVPQIPFLIMTGILDLYT